MDDQKKDKIVLNMLKGKKVICDSSSDDEETKDSNSSRDCGLSLERLNLGPRKKLLVIGLGGLLCHRIYRYDRSSKFTSFGSPDASYGNYFVYKRPHCEDFIKFCLQRFEVGIWSSAREWYLNNALDCVMKGLRSKLMFAWDQKDCTNSGFFTLEKKTKPLFLKNLNKLWRTNSICNGKYSSYNTLLIDDTPYKALLNPLNTAIFPKEYTGDRLNDNDLGPKGSLRLYLEDLAEANDVSEFVKDHPFGKAAITESNSDWDFYSKIVRKFS